MENTLQTELLSKLLQSGIHALHSYDLVLDNINDTVIRNRLKEFREEHQQHIKDLERYILNLGANPDEIVAAPDVKGYITESLTALRNLIGTKSRLKALQSIEEIAYHRYSQAVSQKTPETEHGLLRRHFTDIKNHLEYVSNNLQAL